MGKRGTNDWLLQQINSKGKKSRGREKIFKDGFFQHLGCRLEIGSQLSTGWSSSRQVSEKAEGAQESASVCGLWTLNKERADRTGDSRW